MVTKQYCYFFLQVWLDPRVRVAGMARKVLRDLLVHKDPKETQETQAPEV